MATITNRLAALEQRRSKAVDIRFRRVIQPDYLTAAERRSWQAAQEPGPGRLIIRRPVPWPPMDANDVAILVEMGRSPADLLNRARAMGNTAGEAALMAYAARN